MNPKNRTADDSAVHLEMLEARTLLSSAGDVLIQPSLDLSPQVTGTTVTGLTPAQVKKAYGFDLTTFKSGTVKGDGTSQTIAIVDAYNDPNIKSDLTTFDKKFSLLDPPSFKIVGQTGGSTSSILTDGGWSTEIALDVEWAHAIAPKANILLVEAKSSSLTDLMAGVNYARSASGVSVVSLSWGGSEFFGETSYDKYFTTPAGHQGVTFVAAAGDEGSSFFGGAEWPAVSPDVLSVGGTSLTLKDSTGTYGSETAWRDSSGGLSRYELEPGFEKSVQTTGRASAPDVSYDADPRTGFAVYSSVSDEGFSGWEQVGGTSAGAPQWAALIAIANQGRSLAGKTSLNGVSGTLTALYSLATSTTYSSDFHDITSGASRVSAATKGYDKVTGLGTPHANVVIAALVGGTTSSSSSAAKSTTTTTTIAPKDVSGSAGRHLMRGHDPDLDPPAPPVSSPGGDTPVGVTSPGRTSPPVVSAPTPPTTTTGTLSIGQTQATATLATLRKGAAAVAQADGAVAVVADVTAVAAAKAAANSILPDQASIGSTTHLGGGVSAIFSSMAIDPTGAAARRIAGDVLANAAQGLAAGTARLAHAAFGSAAETMRRTFHFEQIGDPMTLIADAAATFADESALLGSVIAGNRYTKAWAITFSVIAADAMVVLYWSRSRKRSRMSAGGWAFDITGGEIQ